MSTYTNTRDTLNDSTGAKTLDKLVAHELTDFTDDGVKTVGQCGFYNQTQLQTVNLPIATSVGIYAFQGCSGLEKADFGTSCSFGGSSFAGCSKLEALVLRSEGNIC